MELSLSPLTRLRSLSGPVLITGHTGFKGTWLGLLFETLEIPYVGYSLEPEKDSLFTRLDRTGNTSEVFADILNLDLFKKFLSQNNVKAIIHMAAQPLVLRSYEIPLETFAINALGTANILSAASETENVEAVIVVTTDKVYRNSNEGIDFIESDPLQGHDPYSASKVAAESAVDVWRKISQQTGGPQIVSVRAGNVIGGGDWSENRLIPDLVRGFSKPETVEIRSPNSTRPWQHVLDPLVGYLMALESALSGSSANSFNFGPTTSSLSVKTVTEIARSAWPEETKVDYFEKSGNSEAGTLGLDPSLAINSLKWESFWSQEEAIASSIDWWVKVLKKQMDPRKACFEDIQRVLNA
jgi:CDP-glucose 4,6-dehydratase